MSHDPTPFYAAVTAEDERLAVALAAIRAEQEAGQLTVRESADRRIAALEAHLEACRRARQTYLGGDA